jgi:hypothetical protein
MMCTLGLQNMSIVREYFLKQLHCRFQKTLREYFLKPAVSDRVDFLGFLVPTITIRQYITGTARARAGEPGNLSAKCARTRALTNHHGGVGGAVHLEGSSEGPEGAI